MLSREGCRRRRERLWEALPRQVQWVLVADPRHVNYLSGFWVNPLSPSGGERGLLFLERGGESVLVADNLALGSAIAAPFVERTVSVPWYDQIHGVANRDQVLFEALGGIRERFPSDCGLIESQWLPVGAYERIGQPASPPQAAPLTLGALLGKLRRRKDPDEMQLLARCMRAGEAGQRRGRELVRPGISELELYREVQSAAVQAAGQPVLVYGDFRAATAVLPRIGGPPTDYRLQAGDTFILDFSVVLAGYRSDFTATIAAGAPTAQQRELLELCQAALAAGEAALRPGALGGEVYRAVAQPFAAAGKPELFPHHAGHGLGLGHPEAPAFVPESQEVLDSAEVVTLEPGAYLPGVGGVRIEHNYRITDRGCERLTHHDTGL